MGEGDVVVESVHMLSVVGQGDYNRRDNTVEKRPHKKPEAMTGKVVESEGVFRTSVSTLR